MQERRKELGGYLPQRRVVYEPLQSAGRDLVQGLLLQGSGDNAFSTTMVFVGMLKKLLQDKELGKCIVPIIPDEARTFGMDALFKPFGIYSNVGQLYEPVDAKTLLAYREAKDGQILEEGITEAGVDVVVHRRRHGLCHARRSPTIPFFIYYSMFGFQRIGDLIWAAADMRTARLPAGRHRRPHDAQRRRPAARGRPQPPHRLDGAEPAWPTIPAFAFELAVIVQDGIRRMYEIGEDVFYYITLYNENYPMPAMPEGVEEGILRGLYKLRAGVDCQARAARCICSAAVRSCGEALRAQEHPGRAFRRRRRRLERDQLQGAAPRRAGVRALEPAASRRRSRARAISSTCWRTRRASSWRSATT